jgi:pyruvate/2-oxoglutarate dehydrogenase complex dihydrolipoamide dehydrogenase (E3) component
MRAGRRVAGTESVTVVQRGSRLLGRVEAFAGDALRRGRQERGIDVRTMTAAVEVDRIGDKRLRRAVWSLPA